MKGGVLVTEHGGSSDAADMVEKISCLQFDLHGGTSGTMWTWKERGNDNGAAYHPSSDLGEPNGPIEGIRVRLNSCSYARAHLWSDEFWSILLTTSPAPSV